MKNHQQTALDRAVAKSLAKSKTVAPPAQYKPSSVAPSPQLSDEEIQKYVDIIAAAAEGFRPGESTTDRLIRQRLEAQGLKVGA